MMFQVSYTHTGAYGACCAQDYVFADSYDEAWVQADCAAAENETVLDVEPISGKHSYAYWNRWQTKDYR